MLELLALLMQQCLFFLGYITGRSEFPPALNRAEEAELIGKLDAGDHNARQELITHNLRLVSHIARKYQIPGYGADDLISIGVIGLIKAVDSFKSASGTPLGTYAARCIENEILMTLRASRKRRGDVSLSRPGRQRWRRQRHHLSGHSRHGRGRVGKHGHPPRDSGKSTAGAAPSPRA